MSVSELFGLKKEEPKKEEKVKVEQENKKEEMKKEEVKEVKKEETKETSYAYQDEYVALGQYKGLTVDGHISTTVTEDQINEQMIKLLAYASGDERRLVLTKITSTTCNS